MEWKKEAVEWALSELEKAGVIIYDLPPVQPENQVELLAKAIRSINRRVTFLENRIGVPNEE